MKRLPKDFPFRERFVEFLREYKRSTTYWYIPKARALNTAYIKDMQLALTIVIDDFLEAKWNRETQDRLLKRLRKERIFDPYKPEGRLEDRTALVRIWKIQAEWLGLLWVRDEMEIIVTDAGLDLITTKNPVQVIEAQIAKMQYPNPLLDVTYRKDFGGLVPHLFLLEVLRKCGYALSSEEYELFVNLAKCHNDLDRIVAYIEFWRDLGGDDRELVLASAKTVPMADLRKNLQRTLPGLQRVAGPLRFTRIKQNSSYQKLYFTFPRYLSLDQENRHGDIVCTQQDMVDHVVEKLTLHLKVQEFTQLADWFSYFGDPTRKPSWFDYLMQEIEKAPTAIEAKRIVKRHKSKLSGDDRREIEQKQVEKHIEEFYSKSLDMLEDGLSLVTKGRQYSTPIGRIDLLCMSREKEFVVVEIKVGEADDCAFGQILRYIGWIHRNIPEGKNNVRGILLAGYFGDKARYSRIGLLKRNYKRFLALKKHNLDVTDV